VLYTHVILQQVTNSICKLNISHQADVNHLLTMTHQSYSLHGVSELADNQLAKILVNDIIMNAMAGKENIFV